MLNKMDHGLNPSIFRAYDIRGIVGESLTTEGTFLIGKAIGSVLREQQGEQMVIARDGRLSGPQLLNALSDGLLSVGCDVIDLGRVPTPLLYYAIPSFSAHSGIMLTGSHNPPNYNGMKIVMNGQSLAEEGIAHLYSRILNRQFTKGSGKRSEYNIIPRYTEAITENIKLDRSLKVVIDAGNGVAGDIAPALFRALGCEVITLFCEVDGTFPNHHPDPSQFENLKDLMQHVREHQADIGLAFDGDGDRLGVVTNRGEIILPDRLLMLFSMDLLKHHPQANIIYDVKCTHHLGKVIAAHGGIPVMWKTGHSLIKGKMTEIHAKLAGEMSGHFFFKDRWNGFDDALYAGARLLEILAAHSVSSHDLFSSLPNSVNTPELKILVDEDEKFSLMEQLAAKADFTQAKEMMTIDGLRIHFDEGWGLIRPSNTSPYLILRFEAINEIILANIQLLFRDWLLSVKPDLVLPF